jgi:hypothetical protein
MAPDGDRPTDLRATISERGAPWMLSGNAEAVMSAETWREERDRLVLLLEGIESGRITHIDEKDLRELQATSPKNIALLKERLAQLNARLGG